MHESILVGQGDQISSLPAEHWEHHLAQAPEHGKQRLAFMSKTHHLIRDYVVRNLPKVGKPLQLADIASDLDLEVDEVGAILDELERRLFFLVRNSRDAVSWAFPVTVEPTPYRLAFDSGEEVYAA
jgi:hypothetical protein